MDNDEVSLTWRDWRNFCPWCGHQIVLIVKVNTPDLNYDGKILRGNSIYWHAACVYERIRVENEKNKSKKPNQ